MVHVDVSLDKQLDRTFQQELEYKKKTGKFLRPLLVDRNTQTLDKKLMRLKLLDLRKKREECFVKADFKISSNELDAKSIASKIVDVVTNS